MTNNKHIRVCAYEKCKKEYNYEPTYIQYEVKAPKKVYQFCSHDCKAKFLRERAEKRTKAKMKKKQLFEGNYKTFIEPLNDANILIKDSFGKVNKVYAKLVRGIQSDTPIEVIVADVICNLDKMRKINLKIIKDIMGTKVKEHGE